MNADIKLHFEDDLDFQISAVAAVVDLFAGQEINRSEFTVSHREAETNQGTLGLVESQLGIGNKLALLDDEILLNLNAIQLRNGLRQSENLSSGDFTVEMETGTGKTYVYLRTVFELNKNYGFSKFVIVVPSVAIKEGVYKNLQITREHFENLYPMAKGYEYFQYDSSKLGTVRNFATSSNIQIMVTTVQALSRQTNVIYQENEKTGGEKPIDLVKATNPIIIVDEPQSVDGGLKGAGKTALQAMNPLCTLRYSATHIDTHHMVYRLDAVDAYERGLVKQIEVASLEIEGGHNKSYVKLISTHNRQGSITAKVEVDVRRGGGVRREIVTAEDGDDLQQVTGRDIYEDIQIGTITVGPEQTLQLRGPQLDVTLQPGLSHGGVDGDAQKRLMIQRTIKEHLEKEKRFKELKRPIKVLSLLFIDRVDFYRGYDEDKNPVKGKYAKMFEEEYLKLARSPAYNTLFSSIDPAETVEEIHDGYFSIDKKGGWTETEENNQTNRDNAERAYNLIMKDKEKLLSFDTKLRFIFSHSALREGWDNPNVFQICTLRDMNTERQRRQTIGRGLRLAVISDGPSRGHRVRGNEVNTLTVVATESYEDFARNLQTEIEQDTGIRFGLVEAHSFANITYQTDDGRTEVLGVKESEAMFDLLKAEGYVDARGHVQDTLRQAIKDGTLVVPEHLEAHKAAITTVLRKLAGKLDIKNADERRVISTRQAVLESEAFKELWERIKFKTTYRVEFDNEKLIKDCAEAVKNSPPITKTRARFRKADIAIGKGGVASKESSSSAYTTIHENDIELPDIITDLQDKTQLTRGSIVRILRESRRLEDFKRNPQQFIDQAAEAILQTKRKALVDGVKYQRVGEDHYYAQELFALEELTGYLKNTIDAEKSVHQAVVYDSGGVEKGFVEDLEKNEAVKVYAKLPAWFKIPTPLGTYNPDWAVLVEDNGTERLYFVVETKGKTAELDLRGAEYGKIKCGEKHFKSVAVREDPAKYIAATSVDDLMRHVGD